jgi:nitroreductase
LTIFQPIIDFTNKNYRDMTRKVLFTVIAILAAGTLLLNGQTTAVSASDVIMSGYSVKSFSADPVSDGNLETILRCGMKAPSARNSQPWRFTVVRNDELISEVLRGPAPGNVLVIISGTEDKEVGMFVDYDCGLATQNMYIAAQSLGLGAHIYASPIANINSKKESFGIPAGFRAVAVLRIGNIDKGVDAVSSASPRKTYEEMVNFK